MSPLRTFCLLACLLAVANAKRGGPRPFSNSVSNSLRPSEWLSISELESLPAMDELSLEKLENMHTEEGAELVDKIYHLHQINRDLKPNFVPNPNEISGTIVNANGERVNFTLDEFVQAANSHKDFGREEVVIFITGLPSQSETVSKATKKLEQAYMQRFSRQRPQWQQQQQENEQWKHSSSEEDHNTAGNSERPAQGHFIVIDLGATLNDFNQFTKLDIDRIGANIAKMLVQLTDKGIPYESIHLIGQSIGAHVAGATGREYNRMTQHKLRRITGLDPSKIYAKHPNTLSGLARGNAEFVDAIHTSAYGIGTPARVGDVDFYPNGPSTTVPGADNIIEASVRATRYYAESVRPGNEQNFPAAVAASLQQLKNNEASGPRAYMGINTDYDLKGDYILQVNSKSPFGRGASSRQQTVYRPPVHQHNA